jgi:hypothetical protein
MKNPRARRNDLFAESLADETILYDKTNHQAHSLNKTVAMVWESADGEKSVDDIAAILHRSLGIPEDRSIVLLALEQLKSAGLLDTSAELSEEAERPSRRQVARKLALVGASAALVPFVASVLAPTPAMASSRATVTLAQYDADVTTVTTDIIKNVGKFDSSKTAQNDYAAGLVAGSGGNYSGAVSDFDGVLSALGLPPL